MTRGFQASHVRHAQVRQHQFWTRGLGLIYGLQTIIGGPHDLELSCELEEAADRKQSGSRIVGNDHAKSCRYPTPLRAPTGH